MTHPEMRFLDSVLKAFEALSDQVLAKKAFGATAFTVTAGPWTATLDYSGDDLSLAAWSRVWGLWRQVDKYVTTALANGNDRIVFEDAPWHIELDPSKVQADEHA